MMQPVSAGALVAGALLLAAPQASAQESTDATAEPVTIGTSLAIRSAILGEDRRVMVYVPAGYDSDVSGRYPVLYLLDGETQFHHVMGTVAFLSAVFNIPPMIVVGIVNTDRTRDFTPAAASTTARVPGFAPDESLAVEFPSSGGAGAFLRFLTDELVPRIERDYRTAPFRILAGHSLGGLFTLHAALTRPEAFRAYVAASPSLFWDDRALVRTTDAARLARLDGRFLYLTVGDLEMPVTLGNVRQLTFALEQSAPAGLRWWYRVMPNESHPSVMHRSVYDALETIFADYRIAETDLGLWDAAAMEAHFAHLSAAYGWEMRVPEQVLSVMSFIKLMVLQRPDGAIEVMCRAVERYPESAGAHDSLGDVLEAAERPRAALIHRERAARLAEAASDPRLPAFRQKLDALRGSATVPSATPVASACPIR